jgi:hypothetical protein
VRNALVAEVISEALHCLGFGTSAPAALSILPEASATGGIEAPLGSFRRSRFQKDFVKTDLKISRSIAWPSDPDCTNRNKLRP